MVVGQALGDEEQAVLEAEGAAGGDLLDEIVSWVLLGWQDAGIRARGGAVPGCRGLAPEGLMWAEEFGPSGSTT